MRELHYLDNSATTRPCERSLEALREALLEKWGNPSSLYAFGMQAEQTLNKARALVAERLGCKSNEIIFTSGGTEANNLALFGAAYARRKRGRKIVSTAIEHPSVGNVLGVLEQQGFHVIRLKPDPAGIVPADAFSQAIDRDTVLVSVMLVNNETGAIQPVRAAADAIRRAGAPALLHCDAVQAFGKLPVRPASLGVDLLTASGHKIHAPKGAGFLYKRWGVHIPSLLYGGGQEQGLRPGTESVPTVAALGGAIQALPAPETFLAQMERLNAYARDALASSGLQVVFHSPADAAPYILNVSLEGFRSETLLHFLEDRGVLVSSGSACAKGKGSHVLQAMGLPARLIDSALRISFSRETETSDIDALTAGLTDACATLRRA